MDVFFCIGDILGSSIGSFSKQKIFLDTPPKTNMEPEDEALEEEISIRNHHFQVPR